MTEYTDTEERAELQRQEELLHAQLSITNEAYTEAVEQLVMVAKRDTSSSKAAAQLLLSIYNGYNWHLNVTDLGALDNVNLQAALNVLRGRNLIQTNPHEVIGNGERIFSQLEKKWQHLHVHKRYEQYYQS